MMNFQNPDSKDRDQLTALIYSNIRLVRQGNEATFSGWILFVWVDRIAHLRNENAFERCVCVPSKVLRTPWLTWAIPSPSCWVHFNKKSWFLQVGNRIYVAYNSQSIGNTGLQKKKDWNSASLSFLKIRNRDPPAGINGRSFIAQLDGRVEWIENDQIISNSINMYDVRVYLRGIKPLECLAEIRTYWIVYTTQHTLAIRGL